MVAEKSDGLHKDTTIAFFLENQNCVFNLGSKPGSTRHSLALKGKLPVIGFKGRFSRNQCGSFFRLCLIGIAFGNTDFRNAMRCKNYWHPRSSFFAGMLPSFLKLLREGFH